MGSPPSNIHTHRRRNISISATASNVITTDRVRPDWAMKLANARNHLARRSAAATALHSAAYVIGSGGTDPRAFGFGGGRSRFGRARGDSGSGAASGSETPVSPANGITSRAMAEQLSHMRREGRQAAGPSGRSRTADLEEMMMMEAIRLSLAAEEDRKKKADKEDAKNAKKKAKEDKKQEKKDKKVYSGQSSTNGSSLSLSLPFTGRRRGNSGGSNLRGEVTQGDLSAATAKGKGVERDPARTITPSPPLDERSGNSGIPGARHLEASTLTFASDPHQPIASPSTPGQRSHLRHMSTASSLTSSIAESAPNSLRNGHSHAHDSSSTLDSPNASGTNIDHTGGTPDGGDASGSAGSEPMFNFQSLTAMIDDENEKAANAAKHIEDAHATANVGESSSSVTNPDTETPETGLEESMATIRLASSDLASPTVDDPFADTHALDGDSALLEPQTLLEPQPNAPEVMVTPVTPAPLVGDEMAGKQLGAGLEDDAQ